MEKFTEKPEELQHKLLKRIENMNVLEVLEFEDLDNTFIIEIKYKK